MAEQFGPVDIGEFQALRAEPGAMDRHSQMARAVFDAW